MSRGTQYSPRLLSRASCSTPATCRSNISTYGFRLVLSQSIRSALLVLTGHFTIQRAQQRWHEEMPRQRQLTVRPLRLVLLCRRACPFELHQQLSHCRYRIWVKVMHSDRIDRDTDAAWRCQLIVLVVCRATANRKWDSPVPGCTQNGAFNKWLRCFDTSASIRGYVYCRTMSSTARFHFAWCL